MLRAAAAVAASVLPSSMERMEVATVVLVGLLAAQLVLSSLLRLWLPGKTEWKGKQLTAKSTFLAYLVLSSGINVYHSYLGAYGLLYDIDEAWVDPVYGVSQTAVLLCSVQAGYQLYNFLMCGLILELRTAAFLGHHAAVTILAYQAF
jgi:hypothetical protein